MLAKPRTLLEEGQKMKTEMEEKMDEKRGVHRNEQKMEWREREKKRPFKIDYTDVNVKGKRKLQARLGRMRMVR